MSTDETETALLRRGVLAALSAFTIWGFSPVFYHALGNASAFEILAHRVAWSLLLTFAVVSINNRTKALYRVFTDFRLLAWLLLSAFLVSLNWLVFIWAVNHAKALEASMGYFIFPIIMVALGRLFLCEILTRIQLFALFAVCLGVLNLLLAVGQLPWVALTLAISMGLYSLVRKRTPIDALLGLTVECFLLFPLAGIYLVYLYHSDQLIFANLSLGLDLLLASSALMTAVPLILFTASTRILKLGTVGMLQYINPTCQFLIAVFVLDEPFTRDHLITFSLIWLGLVVYSTESHRQMKRAIGNKKAA
ncbi:MAG: EamA family transporter RarD [Sedimenticola sp.]|nr:MAG: EamA family transporter RarD [Sedimenticola sp.]